MTWVVLGLLIALGASILVILYLLVYVSDATHKWAQGQKDLAHEREYRQVLEKILVKERSA